MKVRVVSFTVLGIFFFIFLTSIPAGFWQNSSAPVKADSSTLSMHEGSCVYHSSDIIADCIPNHPKNLHLSAGTSNVPASEEAGISHETALENAGNESENLNSANYPEADQANPIQSSDTSSSENLSAGEKSEAAAQAEGASAEGTPAEGTPAESAPSGTASAAGVQTETAPSSTMPTGSMDSPEIPSEELPGSYPESNFLDGNQTLDSGTSALPKENETQNGTLDSSASTQESAQEYWQAFFDESPMILNGQELEDGQFQNVSANSGMHIMPKESGINGRSIYGLREHFIEDGDTLPKIAARYLGDPERQVEIFELNRKILKSMEELPIGAVLLIPDRF